MSELKEYSYDDIKSHNIKKDLLMVIHDKVYQCSGFVDEHPGGEEVLMDVGGLDATDSFEDVGHSDEAREILAGLLVGTLKRTPGDPKPKLSASGSQAANTSSADAGTAIYAFIVLSIIIGFGAFKYMA
ncbi:cytochrome b5-like heme/steroid binding domain-containing protein [Tricharina praecox]|uniref:cytochrome b5-like heme/steroid binding domain-containing protein n=1 Tax=Tricharina praecox TaxID=43433 RepID=UPI00222039E6|nr:cytochrome b5-like heme/steroid binding domain-containing protein [Tricharina praecox]KAI5849786.1 cytochrome b5-like heme/steroid binding domain-containing protein [Tricharina praecox]